MKIITCFGKDPKSIYGGSKHYLVWDVQPDFSTYFLRRALDYEVPYHSSFFVSTEQADNLDKIVELCLSKGCAARFFPMSDYTSGKAHYYTLDCKSKEVAPNVWQFHYRFFEVCFDNGLPDEVTLELEKEIGKSLFSISDDYKKTPKLILVAEWELAINASKQVSITISVNGDTPKKYASGKAQKLIRMLSTKDIPSSFRVICEKLGYNPHKTLSVLTAYPGILQLFQIDGINRILGRLTEDKRLIKVKHPDPKPHELLDISENAMQYLPEVYAENDFLAIQLLDKCCGTDLVNAFSAWKRLNCPGSEAFYNYAKLVEKLYPNFGLDEVVSCILKETNLCGSTMPIALKNILTYLDRRICSPEVVSIPPSLTNLNIGSALTAKRLPGFSKPDILIDEAGFIVRPPINGDEFITDCHMLGYDAKDIDTLCILFVRRSDDPETPMATVLYDRKKHAHIVFGVLGKKAIGFLKAHTTEIKKALEAKNL